MKITSISFLILLVVSCSNKAIIPTTNFKNIKINILHQEEGLSIRAMEIDKSGMMVFSANNGQYGFHDSKTPLYKQDKVKDSIGQSLEFRGISPSHLGVNIISAGSPALVYKISYTDWKPKLVYEDYSDNVFYDAMKFWNEKEGIAFGDAMNGCMSVLITRDGGENWEKVDCKIFPAADENEGAFAASNTNIEIKGNETWLASKSKIYYSPDKGNSWEVIKTPIISDKETQGIYSLDFYDEKIGIAIGGDYTDAENNTDNLIKTQDGGKNWVVISNETSPGYRSCIQFIPNTNAQGVLAVGYKGINLSNDGGITWQKISEEGFYTVRFLSDKKGYLAGKDRIAMFELQ